MVRRVVLGLLGLHLASMVQSCGVLFAPIAPFLRPPIVLSNIEAPKTAKRGTPVTVRLFATVGDGCGVFRQAGAWVDNTSNTVSFWGYTDTNFSMLCSMMVQCVERDVTFTPANVGTYKLQARVQPGEGYECYSEEYRRLPPPRPLSNLSREQVHEYTLEVEVTE